MSVQWTARGACFSLGVAMRGRWGHTEQGLVMLWGRTSPWNKPARPAWAQGESRLWGGGGEMRGRRGAEQSGAGLQRAEWWTEWWGACKGSQDSGPCKCPRGQGASQVWCSLQRWHVAGTRRCELHVLPLGGRGDRSLAGGRMQHGGRRAEGLAWDRTEKRGWLAWREPVQRGEQEACPRQRRGGPGSLGTGNPAVAQAHGHCLLLSARQLGGLGSCRAPPCAQRESSVRLASFAAEL